MPKKEKIISEPVTETPDDDTSDDELALEKPIEPVEPKKLDGRKKPKTEAQQKAWEKALATRKENAIKRKALKEQLKETEQKEFIAKKKRHEIRQARADKLKDLEIKATVALIEPTEPVEPIEPMENKLKSEVGKKRVIKKVIKYVDSDEESEEEVEYEKPKSKKEQQPIVIINKTVNAPLPVGHKKVLVKPEIKPVFV